MVQLNRTALKYSVAGPLLMSVLLMTGAPRCALALPQNGQVVGGQAAITTSVKELGVIQSTNRAVINWSTFDIASGESVKFTQPSAQSVTLNRVTNGKSASQILGKLDANGTVMISNAQGVIFGAGSQVNVGALVATAADVDNDRFMSGDYSFDRAGNPNASIINDGEINVADGSLVALVGANVANNGIIQAKLGKVQLASGDTFAVDLYGDGLIKLQASDQLTKQIVANSGKISADGGEILMTAAAAQNTINSLINMDGLVEANSVGTQNGRIVLSAENGTVQVSGKVKAKGNNAGEKGGSVDVLGKQVTLQDGAVIDTSGVSGGGSVRVGGDFHGEGAVQNAQNTMIEKGAKILANATENGKGGTVAVWANDTTIFDGSIEAKGGANGGNGGFVETSGKSILQADGLVDASAAKGEAGTWLIDPQDIEIVSVCPVPGTCSLTSSYVRAVQIQSALNSGTSVNITTGAGADAGNILVSANILKSNGAMATLSLNAFNNIQFASGVSVKSTNRRLNVVLNADKDGDGNGFIKMNSGSSIVSNGGDITLGGQSVASTRPAASIILDGATLNAGGGDISIRGAHDLVAAAANNYGVNISNNTSVLTSGAGRITIDGIGGNSFSSAYPYNFGVSIDGSTVTAENGRIAITGIGGSNSNAYDAYNFGVRIADSTVTTTDGAISIKGTGGENQNFVGVNNVGIHVSDNSTIGSTGIGSLTFTGLGGANGTLLGSYDDNYGISAADDNSIGDFLSSGTITFIADTLNVGTSLNIQSLADVVFKTNKNLTTIGVAGAAGTLQITKDILDNISTYSFVIIGDFVDGNGLLRANAYDWNSSAIFYTKNGNIRFNGAQNMGSHSFNAYTQNGDIIFGANGSVTSMATFNAISIGTKTGKFINNRGSDALYAPNNRWVVYSANPSDNVFGDLNSEKTAVWNETYSTLPSPTQTGNRYVFAYQPTLTVTSIDDSKTYGNDASAKVATDYTITGLMTGVANAYLGDSLATVLSGAPTVTSAGSVATADVGSYVISVAQGTMASSAGYGFSLLSSGYLTVDPRTLVITADNQSRPYGDANPALTYGLSGEGLVNGDTLSGVLTTTADVTSNVGTYSITQGTLAATANYAVTYNPGTLLINPAALTVTADDQTVVYGGAYSPYPLTFTYGALKNSDGFGIFTGALDTVPTDTGLGSYAITQGTLSAGANYDVSFVDGVLTINAPADEITASLLSSSRAPATRGLGYNGILLAMSSMPRGALGNLAPAAGGNVTETGSLSPAELASLSPAAGGNPMAGGAAVSLIECNDDTPCQINQ